MIDESFDLEGDTAANVDVERFMATLSEKDRQILELRVEGYTYQEIADTVGYKTHSAVKKRIDKIGRKFQEQTQTSALNSTYRLFSVGVILCLKSQNF